MKNPSLWEAMAHMDPLLIEEADRPVARRRRSVGRTLCIAAAACLLLALGLSGPDVGKALEELLEKVVDGDLPNDRTALLDHLRRTGRTEKEERRT